MKYGEWEDGESSRRDRRDRQSPAGDSQNHREAPTDRWAAPPEDYRTPSRRRAVGRGQQPPTDSYRPNWAGLPIEPDTGVPESAGSAGRDQSVPTQVPETQTTPLWAATDTSSWLRVTEGPSWNAFAVPSPGRRADSPIGRRRRSTDVTSGYVGTRRAEETREARTAVGNDPEQQAPPYADQQLAVPAEEHDRRRWFVPAGSTGRPSADPWDVAGDSWARGSDTGQWDQLTDTGQWDRITDTGQWDGTELRQLVEESEGFWNGTRLAGDDPRWVATPASAPRSPAVGFPDPPEVGAANPGSDAAERAGRDRTAAQLGRTASQMGTAHRPRTGGRHLRTTDERQANHGPRDRQREGGESTGPEGGALAAVSLAALCYLVPALFFLGWLLTLGGRTPAGCVTDVTGGGCDSPRAHAFAAALADAPWFALALGVSVLLALLLHRVVRNWRPASVGVVAAMIGGAIGIGLLNAVSG